MRTSWPSNHNSLVIPPGIVGAFARGVGVQRFTDLRAWKAADAFKKAVLRLCHEGPLSKDRKLREQLEDSACGPPAHIAEGFGRFSPADFARFGVIARSSVMEAQAHLRTAVDKGHIAEALRVELDGLAEAALGEITGLVSTCSHPKP